MTERPLLLSPALVRATLDGLKTQTRRVVARKGWQCVGPAAKPGTAIVASGGGRGFNPTRTEVMPSPYGGPGDLLYVRETWRPYSWHEGEPIVLEYKAGGPHHEAGGSPEAESWEERMWEALSKELDAKGVPTDEHGVYQWEGESPLRWRPSIHLPKWGSRLWLAVRDVRVQRLQEISEEDAIAEGVNGGCLRCGRPQPCGCPHPDPDHRDSFAHLWDSINAARGYGWDTNPWVWAITYEKTEAP